MKCSHEHFSLAPSILIAHENGNESALTFRQSLDKRVREGTLEADLIWDGFHMHPCRVA